MENVHIALIVLVVVSFALGVVVLLDAVGVFTLKSETTATATAASGGAAAAVVGLDGVRVEGDEVILSKPDLVFENPETGVKDVLFKSTAAPVPRALFAEPGQDGSGTLQILANVVQTDNLEVKTLLLSNSVTLTAPSGTTAYTLTLPSSGPTSNDQVMSFNTDGTGSFVALPTGGITQLTGPVTSDTAGLTAITDGAVGVAKLADLSGTSRLIGSGSGAATAAEITLDASLSITGTVLSASTPQNLTGDVTSTGLATTIANGAVTYAKMQNVSANSRLLGSGDAGAGNPPAEITLGTNLSMSGTTLNATVASSGISFRDDANTSITPVIGDANAMIRTTAGTAVTVTIPNNASVAFPVNTLLFLQQAGAGLLTVAPGGGVTINSLFSVLTTSGQYSQVTLHKIATDEWDLKQG